MLLGGHGFSRAVNQQIQSALAPEGTPEIARNHLRNELVFLTVDRYGLRELEVNLSFRGQIHVLTAGSPRHRQATPASYRRANGCAFTASCESSNESPCGCTTTGDRSGPF